MIVSSGPEMRRLARSPWYQANVITTGSPEASNSIEICWIACGQSKASLVSMTPCWMP